MELSGQLLLPAALPMPWYKEAGWSPEPVWTILEKRKSLTFAEVQTADRPASS